MSTEAMVQKIAGILGHDALGQIRETLGIKAPKAPEPDWEKLLSTATTINHFRHIYLNAPRGSVYVESARKSLTALLEIEFKSAKTIDDLEYICDKAPAKGKIWLAAHEKLNMVLRRKLVSAKTIRGCRFVEDHSRSSALDMEVRKKISALLLKRLSSGKTVRDFQYVFANAPANETLERKARESIVRLLKIRLARAKTVRGCIYVFNIPGKSETPWIVQQEAVRKAMGLATTVTEWRQIFFGMTHNYSERVPCIHAIAAILEKQSPAAQT